MATQRPVPTPSGSLDCKPCGAPPRQGDVEGGQCGLLGESRGGIVRSYSLAEKSLEQVQIRYGKEGWTTIAVISWPVGQRTNTISRTHWMPYPAVTSKLPDDVLLFNVDHVEYAASRTHYQRVEGSFV